ncbi:MAG TPA: penicillin-binding protein 1C [Longimicrobiaceae bacterium]|nr:penicillin-binding protein 1C [Longimicrobiaceae bacterium]
MIYRASRRGRLMAGAAAVLGACVLGTAMWIAAPLPDGVASPAPVPRLTLQDRAGLPLRATRARDGSRGGWTPLAAVDPRLVQAFVAAEDHRFFAHHGVDLRSAARALRDNLRGRRRAGASTLTMQTARLLRPIGRSWPGKVRQALWALRLDAHLPKRAILEQYVNRVPLGEATVGVAAAAELYFGASARELSLGQAAMLAGIARSPARDNPLASPARARARRDAVLARMQALGYATADEVARARGEPVLAPKGRSAFLAPHFTTHVLREIDRGDGPRDGVRTTSLDLELQALIEGEVRHSVRLLRDRGGVQAAAVVLDNATGEVLAWVGSPDFWQPGVGQVDMVTSPRQPGSALKPFLYGLAFDRGNTAATVLPDVPRAYSTALEPYKPQNYDRRFHGPVRARVALASSYNVPAVELASRVGVDALLQTLHRAGFSSLTAPASHYGLGLALGNGDVTLLELANGYRALANGGEWTPARWSPAEPGQGPADRQRVISPAAAALVLNVLSDADARAPGFGLETPFDFPFAAAVKTGTSRHFTDNWAVGVTQGFTIAVWVGNFSGQPMDGVSGVSGAGPLLYRSMLAVASRRAPGTLPAPEEAGLQPVRVCRLSGLRATTACESTVEWFVPGTAPSRVDDWERGDGLTLPAEYAEWASAEGGRWAAAVARGHDDRFRIVAPRDGDRYAVPVGVEARYATLGFHAAGARGPVRWYVDGREVRDGRWSLVPGAHTVRAAGATGEVDEVRIVVTGE